MSRLKVQDTTEFLPYFSFLADGTVTGTVYLDMLEDFLTPILEEKGSKYRLFQQGGTSLHLHIAIWHLEDRNCTRKWTETGSQITCPASPFDLTLRDFSFGGTYRMPFTFHHCLPRLTCWESSSCCGYSSTATLTDV